MSDDRDALAERVRAACGRSLYVDHVVDIARAEYDRARQELFQEIEARFECHEDSDNDCAHCFAREELRALQRPQQPDKPEPYKPDVIVSAKDQPEVFNVHVRDDDKMEITPPDRPQAQPAPDVDAFVAFVAEVRAGSEGRTLPWSEMESLARVTFGPAIKMLETIEAEHGWYSSFAASVLTDLRERARRVTG